MGYFFDSILNPPDPKIDQLSISSWWESGWGGNYLFVHSQVETLFFFFYIQRYIAIYDYTAADDDEVTFSEGDVIVDATVIDEGWMEGRVQRTGQYGMLPSNYVEKI